MNLAVYTDGGSLGNPGPAAVAFVVYQDNKLIFKFSQLIGRATNNVAEYTALIKALTWVKDFLVRQSPNLSVSQIEVYSDSSLLVNQLNGYFKVKNGIIREFILKIRALENEINLPVFYHHLKREKNRLADSLVKAALKNR